MKGISLFSSSGIGEYFFEDAGIEIVAANELLPQRAEFYSFLYPKTTMIKGSIENKQIKKEIKSFIKKDVKFLIATPPCQGLSTLGKNKVQKDYEKDRRNYLIFEIFEIMDMGNFDYILIENVPKYLDMYFNYKENSKKLIEILEEQYGKKYNIESDVLNAQNYGVPQARPRAVIKLFRKGLTWKWPKTKKIIPLKKAIGHLPSLEPGEKSKLKHHYAKKPSKRIELALRHTPTGKSAIQNKVYFPKKENGERIKGFHNTYKRMNWDDPCHARTTYNGSISSHNNIHPGKKMKNGTYSDPRVLSLRETFIVSSLPEEFTFPEKFSETFIRTIIGEGVPPLFLKEIVGGINNDL